MALTETLSTGGVESVSTAGSLNVLRESMGPGALNIASIAANTAFLVGGLFFAYKGIQMVVTGKNSFKKTA